MKKFALALALVLFVCATVPALAASPTDVLGVWYLKSFEYYNSMASLEGDYKVEFNRDRSALLVLNGTEMQTTWDLRDNGAEIKMENGTETFELQEDGTLKAYLKIYDDNSWYCYFAREKEEIQIPALADATSEEDYFGTYALTLQKNGNLLQPVENGEALLKIAIEFAQVTITGESLYSTQPVMSDYQEGKVVIPAYGIVSGSTEENKLYIGKTETGIAVTTDVAPDMMYFLNPVNATETADPAGTGTGE